MSYMSRLWMATSVAVVNSHSDQGGQKLKSGLKSINHLKKRFFSGGSGGRVPDATDVRPLSAVMSSEIGGAPGGDQRRQSEESLRQVMYLNCWGQG